MDRRFLLPILAGVAALLALAAIPSDNRHRASRTVPPVKGTFEMMGGQTFPSLAWLCKNSPVVLLVQPLAIFRADYAPVGSTDAVSNPPVTVYSCSIEQVLAGSYVANQTVKVNLDGAVLNGNAYPVIGEPLLTIGNRYLLFLKVPKAGGEVAQDQNGNLGTVCYVDELFPSDQVRGVVWLDGGAAKPNVDAYSAATPQPFDVGDQLFTQNGTTVTESQAITSTQQAIIDAGSLP